MPNGRPLTRGQAPSAVADHLPRLKREGCNLLVSGDVSAATANRVTRRLFGSPTLERTRIVVRTPDAPPADALLPTGVDADDPGVRLVAYDPDRSNPLESLVREVDDAVREFRSQPSFVGGELRLSVTSLESLVDRHGTAAVERSLSALTELVSDARGLGHYRYRGVRTDVSDLQVDLLFDGFIDLRESPTPQQRFSLPSVGPSEWVTL